MDGLYGADPDQSTDAEAVIITEYSRSRIRGSDNEDIMVESLNGGEDFLLIQEGDIVGLTRAEAEALFIVLDRMLNDDAVYSV